MLVAGCGGGTTTSGTNPPPPADNFSIVASPASLTLGTGGSQTVTVSVAEVNTYTASVNLSVSGLPTGITASPATFTLSPGNQKVVTLNAAATAATGAATITFQGTSGSLSHSASTTLSIVAPADGAHAPTRVQYLRTNSSYDPNSFQYSPPHFTTYDAVHKQFFVSNPYMNEIDVFSATQETQIATIPVPMPWGIDVSPYNGSLYAGTFLGDVYQIDTSTLSVTKRFPAASIGPKGFPALTALVLSDGRLALQGGEVGIEGLDGSGVIEIWNPITNALDAGTNGGVCNVGNEGVLALSGDRTRVLVTWVDTGVSVPICSYDPVAQVATYGSLPTDSFVSSIVPTPDGTRFFLLTTLDGIAVFDAKTMQLLGQIGGGTGLAFPNGDASAIVSLDGKTLYVGGSPIATYNTTSLAQTGWITNFGVNDSQSEIVLSAIDETGLIAGPIGHGVAFLDGSTIEAAAPTAFVSGIGATPSTGPFAGGTTLTGFILASATNPTPGVKVTQMYVGNLHGMNPSLTGSNGHLPSATVTTPASSFGGAVDLTIQMSDGGVGVAPEAFSYGPTILEVVPNGATAEGGQTGTLIGYGFGNSISAVQVTIGEHSAPVTAISDSAPISPYPFPTNALQFTIPPGTAGSSSDVTVTTPSGSITAKSAFHYTAATNFYPIAASLQAGIYDAGRNLYYFADQNQIQILSKATGEWLTPIALPNVSAKAQLLAIAESPDGTRLAVSDYGGQAIYVVNPDNPASATGYPMSLDQNFFSSSLAPDGLAVTNTGMVYFDTNDIGGTGGTAIHKLDTSAGTMTDLYYMYRGTINYPSSGGRVDKFDRVIFSPDGTNIYTNVEGASYVINPSNGQMTPSGIISSAGGAVQELEVSGDSSTVDINGFITDESLNIETEPAYIDWETWVPTAVIGQKLNQDGSILFQPLTDGIDLIARNTGRLLYRIQIPVTPADVYDPLVIADGQNTLAVITSTGVSFIDLSSLPIPSQYTQPFAMATRSTASSVSDSHIALLANQTTSTRTAYSSTRPKLRRKVEQPKALVQSPITLLH